MLVAAAVAAAQTWIELPTTVKVPVLVHTPEAFAADLADTVTKRLAVMLDERCPVVPDVADWQTWHLQLMRWHDLYGAMDKPGGDLDLRQVARMMP